MVSESQKMFLDSLSHKHDVSFRYTDEIDKQNARFRDLAQVCKLETLQEIDKRAVFKTLGYTESDVSKIFTYFNI